MTLNAGGRCARSKWVHLACWRVPNQVHQQLPDPNNGCADVDAFRAALARQNEVQLCGFSELPEHAKYVNSLSPGTPMLRHGWLLLCCALMRGRWRCHVDGITWDGLENSGCGVLWCWNPLRCGLGRVLGRNALVKHVMLKDNWAVKRAVKKNTGGNWTKDDKPTAGTGAKGTRVDELSPVRPQSGCATSFVKATGNRRREGSLGGRLSKLT
jgi:hypothetical protein